MRGKGSERFKDQRRTRFHSICLFIITEATEHGSKSQKIQYVVKLTLSRLQVYVLGEGVLIALHRKQDFYFILHVENVIDLSLIILLVS